MIHKTFERQDRKAKIDPETHKFLGEKVRTYMSKFGATTAIQKANYNATKPLYYSYDTVMKLAWGGSIQRVGLEFIIKELGLLILLKDGVFKHVENEG